MSSKTIFIIIITVLVTVILMNNTEEVEFWIFGIARVPKLAVLGGMFAFGFVFGFLAGRPRRKKVVINDHSSPASPTAEPDDFRPKLSDEDRDYIS
ncbi:hypothetical protein [Pararcticibacter amylolyticus]|uniref:LapA family protein n=1 Tax=Pararcticibacter amylolyticus TaxID=2173175 RepID=A0A2U2PEE6_9SPHI|nr:hypothetical protein [Pararcticibacter amylolyticus]PWG79743.1 hypothetical protein DDR33_15115 [Pararcticibacter amylolyticus]